MICVIGGKKSRATFGTVPAIDLLAVAFYVGAGSVKMRRQVLISHCILGNEALKLGVCHILATARL